MQLCVGGLGANGQARHSPLRNRGARQLLLAGGNPVARRGRARQARCAGMLAPGGRFANHRRASPNRSRELPCASWRIQGPSCAVERGPPAVQLRGLPQAVPRVGCCLRVRSVPPRGREGAHRGPACVRQGAGRPHRCGGRPDWHCRERPAASGGAAALRGRAVRLQALKPAHGGVVHGGDDSRSVCQARGSQGRAPSRCGQGQD
mmetsp:Transcript_23366/g.88691  ORF Transcript_23366/g.88691 Transcript_23366/m.88691 type:complete len:205 (-) Transcript_23366:2365-2979(-)